MSHERLVAGYLAHAEAVARDQQDQHFWAYLDLHRLAQQKPQAAWPLVVEVVKRVTDEETLGYVSADILEDLLCENGPALIDRVEAQAGADEHFRQALSSVRGWNRMPPDVRARLDVLIGRPADTDKRGAG